ncbi:MAG TPA: TIGR03118 family protein [Candidatus Binataceae bacterium]|jgi:uncharacterized protein (TIGR03118 family)|nr:TIGR03118 family protein [Candidatus Binataceae bacterium]
MLFTYRYRVMAIAIAAAAIMLHAGAALSFDDGHSTYVRTDMVSDNTAVVPAAVQDPRLINAWGLVFAPTSPFWINDNNSGLSTLYAFDSVTGLVDPLPQPSVVIPPPSPEPGAQAAPTGIVFNPANVLAPGTPEFHGDIFIFDTEDGTVSGWQPTFGNNAMLRVDNKQAPSAGPVYKGLAIGTDGSNTELFATNFRSGEIDVYDVNYQKVVLPLSAFVDPELPAGYAPFGIANINNSLYVTYALQNSFKHDDVKGPGHGFVDEYSTHGKLLRRFASRGTLDSPWGITMAPKDGFGSASGHILIGNFGDGGINVFDPRSRHSDGFLKNANGDSIAPDHLWSLSFGNGNAAGPTTTLFFTAGPNDESDGLFGKIEVAPGSKH